MLSGNKDDYNTKPSRGMWNFMRDRILFGKIDMENSFFCGDGAGYLSKSKE
jgi:hypothetical protein